MLNIAESTTLGKDLEEAVSRYKLEEVASRPNAGATAICGKVEAELWEMSDVVAAEFLSSPTALPRVGSSRLIRKSYELLGLVSFFTVGEDECRAWTIPVSLPAPKRQPAPSTPISKSTSSAPKPSTGARCWPRVLKPLPAPRAHCVLKARTTGSKMEMS